MVQPPRFDAEPEFREATHSDAVVDTASSYLISRLGLVACWFESFPFDAQMARIEAGRIVLPAAEPGVAPWAFGGGVELPVRFAGLTLGRFVLVPTGRSSGVIISPSERAEAIAWADAVGHVVAAAILDKATGGPPRAEPR
jgi:hypothetical protein